MDDEHFLAARVDSNAETGKIAIPEDGILAVDGEAVHDALGEAAEAYGDIVASAERAGTPINVADGLIAAIALVHGMSIATRDISDFDVTGVPLVNPWDFTMPGNS